MSRLTWAARLWSEGGALGKQWTQRAWEQEGTAYQPLVFIHVAQYVLVHTHKRNDSRNEHSQDKATMTVLENNALSSLAWWDWHQGGNQEARQKSRPFASAEGRKAARREAWWTRKELNKHAWPGLTGNPPPQLWFSGSTRYTQITSAPYHRASRVHVIQKMLLGTGVTLVILALWKQRQEDHKKTSQAEPPGRLSVNNTNGRTEYCGAILWSQCQGGWGGTERLRPACHTYAKPKTIPPPLPPHIPPNSNGKRAVPIMEKQPPKKKPKQNTNLKILQDLRKPKPLNHKPISFLKKRS